MIRTTASRTASRMPVEIHAEAVNSSGLSRPVTGFGRERQEAEQELDEQRVPLPITQSAEWLIASGYVGSTLITARDSSGRPVAAAGVGIGRTRSLPGHVIYRIDRFGASGVIAADEEILRGLTRAARDDARCVRVHLGIFERDATARQQLAAILSTLGYVKALNTSGYQRTLSLDLNRAEGELFANLAASARRNVRLPAKRGFQIRPIEDSMYVERLEALMNEVFDRTGGTVRRLPWGAIVDMSRRLPNRSRVAGLFEPNASGPDALIGFSWGCRNGRYVTYEAGASTRGRGHGNLPLAYAPLWDLISWAKSIDAEWFDLGGVTVAASPGDGDPLSGISDFKRFFCDRAVDVGEDWILETRPVRSRIARALSAALEHVGS